jgi:hypothetical protein
VATKSGRQKRRIQSRHLTGRSSNRIPISSSKLFGWEMQMSYRWQYGHSLYPILSTLLPTRRGKTGAAHAIQANLAPGIGVRQLCLGALQVERLLPFSSEDGNWNLSPEI